MAEEPEPVPKPPVCTQALLPWTWPAAQEGLPEKKSVSGGRANAEQVSPGSVRTTATQPAARAEKLGHGAGRRRGSRSVRGSPFPGVLGARCWKQLSMPSCVCARVPCAYMLVRRRV